MLHLKILKETKTLVPPIIINYEKNINKLGKIICTFDELTRIRLRLRFRGELSSLE
jgi:hypothetical protein